MPPKSNISFVRKWCTSVRLLTVEQLRNLCQELKDTPVDDHASLEIGYLEPGHGTQGKERWVLMMKISGIHVCTRCMVYSKKGEIMLWILNSAT